MSGKCNCKSLEVKWFLAALCTLFVHVVVTMMTILSQSNVSMKDEHSVVSVSSVPWHMSHPPATISSIYHISCTRSICTGSGCTLVSWASGYPLMNWMSHAVPTSQGCHRKCLYQEHSAIKLCQPPEHESASSFYSWQPATTATAGHQLGWFISPQLPLVLIPFMSCHS